MDAADLPIAVIAGGRATRLGPLAEKVPKLLLELAGEPFFSHQLRLLKKSGLARIVLCVGHLGERIVDRYGDGAKWGVKIDYSFDGPKPLGTGGALIKALPLLGDAFYVLYGDSYLPVDYQAVGRAFLACSQPALMTVFENQGLYDASNVWFAGGRIRAYSKTNRIPEMKHIDYGLGALTSQVFQGWSRSRAVDLADVYGQLVLEGRLAGYEVRERFYEIGSPSGLRELDQLLKGSKGLRD